MKKKKICLTPSVVTCPSGCRRIIRILPSICRASPIRHDVVSQSSASVVVVVVPVVQS